MAEQYSLKWTLNDRFLRSFSWQFSFTLRVLAGNLLREEFAVELFFHILFCCSCLPWGLNRDLLTNKPIYYRMTEFEKLFMAIFFYARSFNKKSAERKSAEEIFVHISLCWKSLTWGLNRGFISQHTTISSTTSNSWLQASNSKTFWKNCMFMEKALCSLNNCSFSLWPFYLFSNLNHFHCIGLHFKCWSHYSPSLLTISCKNFMFMEEALCSLKNCSFSLWPFYLFSNLNHLHCIGLNFKRWSHYSPPLSTISADDGKCRTQTCVSLLLLTSLATCCFCNNVTKALVMFTWSKNKTTNQLSLSITITKHVLILWLHFLKATCCHWLHDMLHNSDDYNDNDNIAAADNDDVDYITTAF